MTNASNVALRQHEGYQHELTITRKDTPSQQSLAHECMSYHTRPLLDPVLRCLQRSTAPYSSTNATYDMMPFTFTLTCMD